MKKRTKNIVVSAVLVVAIAVCGAFAYLTDSDQATNTFTMGEVRIDLREPEYDPQDPDATPNAMDTNDNDIPDAGENLWAGKIVNKNPFIVNTGANDAFVYISVEIPKAVVKTADANGNVTPEAANTQLFNLLNLDTDNWTLVSSKTITQNSNVYLYAYNTALAPEAETSKLFTQVQLANLIENQVAVGTTEDIIINAYAVQTVFSGEKANCDTPLEAWDLFMGSHGIIGAEVTLLTDEVEMEFAEGTWDLEFEVTAIKGDGTRVLLNEDQYVVEQVAFDGDGTYAFDMWVYNEFSNDLILIS